MFNVKQNSTVKLNTLIDKLYCTKLVTWLQICNEWSVRGLLRVPTRGRGQGGGRGVGAARHHPQAGHRHCHGLGGQQLCGQCPHAVDQYAELKERLTKRVRAGEKVP